MCLLQDGRRGLPGTRVPRGVWGADAGALRALCGGLRPREGSGWVRCGGAESERGVLRGLPKRHLPVPRAARARLQAVQRAVRRVRVFAARGLRRGDAWRVYVRHEGVQLVLGMPGGTVAECSAMPRPC